MSLKTTLLAVAAFAGSFGAQNAPSRSTLAGASAPAILARLGTDPEARWFLDLLRQVDGPQPRAKLDELADSLAERAINGGAGKPHSVRAAAAIGPMIALTIAGNPATKSGQAYDGAVDRLIRIHRESKISKVRSQALAMMIGVSGRSRSLPYLTRVATSTDETAFNAMSILVTDAAGGSWGGAAPTVEEQDATNALLQRLVDEKLVVDPLAARVLDRWVIATHGKPPR